MKKKINIKSAKLSQTFKKGPYHFELTDIYHILITLSWVQFFGLMGGLFLLCNVGFALLYLIGGDCIHNARPGNFGDMFFFSVQTMATIGYGGMSPITPYANMVVTIEALVGLTGVAMMTGLGFARFSLPTARILFSKIAVVCPYNGVPTLMFRTANARGNLIVEGTVNVTILQSEINKEGEFMRRFHDLKLVRDRTPMLTLSWTIMHPIDENSPLYQYTSETFVEKEIEIIVTMTGIDETVSQTIHAHHTYIGSEVFYNKRFADIFSVSSSGNRVIDYGRFHDAISIDD